MKTTGRRLVLCSVILCYMIALTPASPSIAGTFTPLAWQDSSDAAQQTRARLSGLASSEDGLPGAIDVLVGFNRCIQPKDREALSGYIIAESGLVSAAVLRVQNLGELASIFSPQSNVPDDLGISVFQIRSLQVAHGTTVRAHEAKGSWVYPGKRPHELGITGTDIPIAVLDSGVGTDHVQLDDLDSSGRLIAGFDATKFSDRDGDGIDDEPQSRPDEPADGTTDPEPDHPHGSSVAGVALGRDLSHLSYRCRSFPCGSMAPSASLVDVRVSKRSEVYLVDAIEGMTWLGRYFDRRIAPHPAVANLSFFGCEDDKDGRLPLAQEADALAALGVTVVAAHGNASSCGLLPKTLHTGSPGSAVDAITVAGTDDRGSITREDDESYSDGLKGPRSDGAEKPDLSAGAEAVLAPVPISTGNDLFAPVRGTSFSAAHVSGAAALIHQAIPHIDPRSVKYELLAGADRQRNAGNTWDPKLGWGILRLDWLGARIKASEIDLDDLTFAGCKTASPGPLGDCELKNGDPSWSNEDAFSLTRDSNGKLSAVTVKLVKRGSVPVTAVVRLEGHDRTIGNRQYHLLGEEKVDLEASSSEEDYVEVSFGVSGIPDDLVHFRASVHSGWDRSYADNRTRWNLPAVGDDAELHLDNPTFDDVELRLAFAQGDCTVKEGDRAIPAGSAYQLGARDCPRPLTLLRNHDAATCELRVFLDSEELGGFLLRAPDPG